MSVFMHIFPLWHVAGLVHRVPPGTSSHTHRYTHTYYTVYFNAQAALSAKPKRDKEDFALGQIE